MAFILKHIIKKDYEDIPSHSGTSVDVDMV